MIPIFCQKDFDLKQQLFMVFFIFKCWAILIFSGKF